MHLLQRKSSSVYYKLPWTVSMETRTRKSLRDEPIQGKAGTRGTAQSSVKALLQFVDMLEKTNKLLPQVDNRLVDFGRFVLQAELLTDKDDKHLQILEERRKICVEHNIPFRKLGATTFRTYINAIGSVFNEGGGVPKLVMSSTTQFPLFDTFTKQCVTRHLDHKACTVQNNLRQVF